MSDTILGGRWIVYYEAENRQKRLVRDTSVSPTTIDTANQVYSALQDLFDELTQMDDGIPMSAQTPTEYTIGIIESGDKDPWFIDRTSVEYLKGGSLKTASWARSTGTNTGIVRITYTTGTDFVASDIGKTVTNATGGDSGTLLDFNNVGATKYAWIRPASNAAANDWDSTSGTVSVTGGTGSVTQASAAVSGESLWANIYSIGSLVDFTHLYVYQGSPAAVLRKYKSTTEDWWSDGHIDILVNVKETGTLVDQGYVTVFAREYGNTQDNYIVDLSAGGRNPIPLSTGGDLNNDTGYRTFTGSAGTGTFTVGNYLYVGANWAAATTSGKRARITAATTGATPTITYYLIGGTGGVITDFSNGDAIKEYTGIADGDATCTAGTPANAGPATYSTVTITHAQDESVDLNEDGTNENYSIAIDLASTYTVKQGYERTKYLFRRGNTDTTDTDGIQGERYIGTEYRITYGTLTGTIAEGATVTQLNSNATGVVVAHHLAGGTLPDKILVLRNTRGTFNNTDDIRVDGSNYVSTPVCTSITPIKAAPFGTFAGGKWFLAPGVILKNYLAADANNFQALDDLGTVVSAPTKITVSVTNTRAGDKVSVFKLTGAGGSIKKDMFTGTAQSLGATSVVTGGTIPADTVGRSTGGTIILVDVSANVEYRLRFSSWATTTFVLASSGALTADAGTDTDTIVDAGAFAGAKVGDLIRNSTRSAISYITTVVSDNQVEIFPAIAGQTTGDSYTINTLPVATTTSDTYYVPLLNSYETTGSDGTPGTESAGLTYLADIPVLVRARQKGSMLPYSTEATVVNTGLSNNIIRTPDTIVT